MSRTLKTVWIGLDWGTHSSKWWFTIEDSSGKQDESSRAEVVVDSTIYRSGSELRIVRERSPIKSDVRDARLKRMLLKDPLGASYWDAVREGIGLSLGEAAAFSLAVLIGDASSSLENRGYKVSPNETEIRLRFSLPNWISGDMEHQAARKRMFQTAAAVGAVLGRVGFEGLPRAGQELQIEEWRSLLRDVRGSEAFKQFLGRAVVDFAPLVENEFELPGRRDIRWRLTAESSAAGFPQLQNLLMLDEETRKVQDQWVKLLVVDVGAGSTDAGYFISSRRANGKLVLNYLRPAPTLDYAGEQLTEMLKKFYLRKNNRDMTIQEAETLKLSAPDEWKNEPFVVAWRDAIAEYVGDYMLYVPDHRRLAEPAIPGLKIVMTGGSGLVEGADRAVRNSVVEALVRRGVQGNVANRTEITELSLDWPKDRIDRARRAVSIGDGNSRFGDLKYIEEFEKAAPPPGPVDRW